MPEAKTKKTKAAVEGFLNAIEHDTRREDGLALLEMMSEVTGEEPAMWGPSVVGCVGEGHCSKPHNSN